MKAITKLKAQAAAKAAVEPGAATPKKSGQKLRTVLEIVSLLEDGQDLQHVAKTITEEELILMIDSGVEMEAERRAADKQTEKVVKPVKQLLLQVAKNAKWKEKKGTKGMAKVSASTWSDVGTGTQLAALLKKEGKIQLFDDLVTIRVGDCKKFLGTDALKGFITPHSEEFGAVALKEL